jgi:hypothetical protein
MSVSPILVRRVPSASILKEALTVYATTPLDSLKTAQLDALVKLDGKI